MNPPGAPVTRFPVLLLSLLAHLRADEEDRERGDVPGWVLITIMTAGLVTVLWALADDTLSNILSDALDSVSGPGD